MKYVRSAHLGSRWKEMNDMAAVAEEKRMDVVLPQCDKPMAVEVMEFLNGLNQGEQRDFMYFLHGAKFVMTLSGKPAKETV